jgi:hypothetical protein
MMMNKRGIEALVATVLLVLIVIAAVGIIWGAVMPIIRQNIDTSQKCLNAGIEVNTQGGYTYATGTTSVSVQVSRGPSTVTVSSIDIKVVNDAGNSGTNSTTDVPLPNSDKVYPITMASLGLSGTTAKRVGVAPTIMVGNTKVVCPMKEVDIPAA